MPRTIVSLLIVFSLIFVSVQSACSQSAARALTPEEDALVQSNGDFGFKLFQEIVKQEQGKNIFISPLSVAMALGMTLNGAEGETRKAMEKTLALSGLTQEEINQSYKSLIKLLRELDSKVTLKLANSIWYKEGYSFRQEFLDQAGNYFDAGVKGVDFGDSQSVKDEINDWVKENTNGKIEKMIDEIDSDVVMELINTLYFKALWTSSFDENRTRDDWFTLLDGSKKACRMMNRDIGALYTENADFQAVDLPYGNGDYSMTIVLPQMGKDVDSLLLEFSDDKLSEWYNNSSKQGISLELPKFTIEYELLLNEALTALGMGIAFSGSADFSGMTGYKDLYIYKVMHKTFIEVNETGTEAAAATQVEMKPKGDSPSLTSMRVDRPFIFVIREHQSGTILFVGKIVDPTQE